MPQAEIWIGRYTRTEDRLLYLGKNSAHLKQLRRRIRRRVEGEVIVDGCRLLDDLVRWDLKISELYLAENLAETADASAWTEVADRTFVLNADVLSSVAPTRNPQGVLAVVEAPQWPPWPAVEGVGLYLEGVQDPGNLGAIIRAAAGLGAAAVLLAPGCADPLGPAAVRGSAGAVFRIPIEREVTLNRAAERLRRQRGEVWATGAGGVTVQQWQPTTPLLIMMGTEGRGLSNEAIALAQGIVTIPLQREVESLNVAVAAGIVLSNLV